MFAFYVIFLTFALLVAYAGFDATLRLVAYLDALFQTQIIEIRLWFLKKRLGLDKEFGPPKK